MRTDTKLTTGLHLLRCQEMAEWLSDLACAGDSTITSRVDMATIGLWYSYLAGETDSPPV